MKITVPEDSVWWHIVCKCGAIIEAEPADVTSRPNLDEDYDQVGVIPVVACERCGKEHDVPDKLRTPMVMRIAEDYDRHKGKRR